ncbi:BatD family protein, partial [Desulfosarcina sp. OttesenSCG-928-G10]|nr:BatD family protein [Desulfosarcina sp. OttesenSCG-928-G10]
MIRSFFILPLFLLALATTAGAATVRAVVDRDAIVAGETLHLQIIVEDGVGTPDLSGVTGFKATFRGMNRKFQMINNRTIRQAIHNYTLIPLKNGKLTLPAIPVGLDGTVHYTLPIAIRVSEKKPVDSDQQDIYVTAAISDTTVRVGQTFTYTFRLFTATRIAKAQFEPPDFDGFLAERQGDRKSYRTMINGRKFTAIEIIFILVPTAAGTPTLAPATVEASVASRSRRSGRSGDPVVGRNEISTRILRTEPISVEVRPLPEPPAGSNFSGLVGEFEITAALDKTDVQVGDSALLTVTIQGRGDIRGAGAPEISIPSAFKAYPDAPKTARHKNAAGYSGSKVFRTALVPVTPGDYRIEPVT